MPLSLTVLVENTAPEGLKKEHGLSVLVETESTRILFDTGAGNALGPNLDALGLDIDPLDAVILSHGHYDHGGGLPEVRHRLGNLPVHAHPEALTPRFSLHPGRPPKQIGLPENVRHMLKTRLVPTPEAMEVAPGLYVTGKVPRITDFEDTGGPFYLDEAGTRPDPLNDDMALFADTPDGLVILAGCAHAGIVNILEHVASLRPGRPLHAVVGGFHLISAGEDRINATLSAFEKHQIAQLVPGHCTGETAIAKIRARFPDRIQTLHTGKVLDFGT